MTRENGYPERFVCRAFGCDFNSRGVCEYLLSGGGLDGIPGYCIYSIYLRGRLEDGE